MSERDIGRWQRMGISMGGSRDRPRAPRRQKGTQQRLSLGILSPHAFSLPLFSLPSSSCVAPLLFVCRSPPRVPLPSGFVLALVRRHAYLLPRSVRTAIPLVRCVALAVPSSLSPKLIRSSNRIGVRGCVSSAVVVHHCVFVLPVVLPSLRLYIEWSR